MKEFNDYILIREFMYPNEPLKKLKWLNATNYTNPFNTDWNSLMSVVEKIEKTYRQGGQNMVTVHIIGNACDIMRTGAAPRSSFNKDALSELRENRIHTYSSESKIDAVYKAVLKFINLYNKHK